MAPVKIKLGLPYEAKIYTGGTQSPKDCSIVVYL